MNGSLCKTIKARSTLRSVAGLVGIELPQDGVKFRSVFRPDNSPSCSVKGNLYTDWSTGDHLDQIDFYAAAKGLRRQEAIRDLARINRIVGDRPTRHTERPDQANQDKRATKAGKRAAWPSFELPTSEEFKLIAELRGLGVEGVQMAVSRGLLFTVKDRGARAWAVTDSTRLNARVRRMDGRLWYGENKSMPPTGGGQESSWPVGINEAHSFPSIAMVEGEGDLIAAFHLAWCADLESSMTVVAMLGACPRISTDALPLFAGKRVRIFEDNDSPGEMAAAKWAQQLLAVGATVDSFSFDGLLRTDGKPVKDMTDFVHLCPDQWESERTRVESAFNFVIHPPIGATKSDV